MNPNIIAAMQIDGPHEMEFWGVGSGYIVTYHCRHCEENEHYDCGYIERIPSYAEARSTYPRFTPALTTADDVATIRSSPDSWAANE